MAGPSVDVRGAAQATGLSPKAIRRRIERGTLPTVLVDGRRRIPVDALRRAGLLVEDAASGARRGRGPLPVDVDALLDRLERQAEEIGRLRAEVQRLRGGR